MCFPLKSLAKKIYVKKHEWILKVEKTYTIESYSINPAIWFSPYIDNVSYLLKKSYKENLLQFFVNEAQ